MQGFRIANHVAKWDRQLHGKAEREGEPAQIMKTPVKLLIVAALAVAVIAAVAFKKGKPTADSTDAAPTATATAASPDTANTTPVANAKLPKLLDLGAGKWPGISQVMSEPRVRDWFYYRARAATAARFKGLASSGQTVTVIGDAAKPGKSKEAIASAFDAALLGK